jgi:hypothetical protein
MVTAVRTPMTHASGHSPRGGERKTVKWLQEGDTRSKVGRNGASNRVGGGQSAVGTVLGHAATMLTVPSPYLIPRDPTALRS